MHKAQIIMHKLTAKLMRYATAPQAKSTKGNATLINKLRHSVVFAGQRPCRQGNTTPVNKLRDEQGASFIIALVFFFICATVAAIILVSATVNVERTTQRRIEEQAYISLNSAALLIQEDIRVSPMLTGTETKIIYGCRNPTAYGYSWVQNPHEDEFLEPSFTPTVSSENTVISSYLYEQAKQVFLSKTSYTAPTTFAESPVSFKITADEMNTVLGEMVMDEHYKTTIILRVESEDYKYTMNLEIPAVVTTSGESTQTTEETHRATQNQRPWQTVNNATFPVTTYSMQTQVTWNECFITKGAVVS